ncbi:MAG: DUF2793 domain-containing protein [Sphingosinicella sp.]|uniref:DUF2793 domain-containing protein n=1 Tax=Sphingosinicella sp. TaxID=1917971 RepID=UPI0040378CAF
MTETSARFALPFIVPGQAQKEAFHNEALVALDCALHACVETDPLADPPVAPEPGQSWIVAADSTGAWAEKTDALACWTAGGWRFIVPLAGMIVWNKAAGHWLHWTGGAWANGAWPVSALTIDGLQVVGERLPDVPSPSGGTTIDAEARSAIDLLIATLKSHGLIE